MDAQPHVAEPPYVQETDGAESTLVLLLLDDESDDFRRPRPSPSPSARAIAPMITNMSMQPIIPAHSFQFVWRGGGCRTIG